MSRTRILKRMGLIFLISIVVLTVITGARLFMLRGDLTSFARYWNQRAAEEVPDNALVYVALGDSAAQGIGASRPEKGYVGLLEEALEDKNDQPVHVINLSVSGAKVQDVTDKQLPQLKEMKVQPGIITLAIGGNDIIQYDRDRFTEQINTLFSQLPAQTVVADIPYFGGGRYNSREQNASDASAIIAAAADRYELRLAPLHRVTTERDSPFIYAVDFFHPNDRGYRNWFAAFWTVLDR